MKKEEKGYIRLTIRIEKEDKAFSAFCEELGLATCGATFEEAEKRLKALTTSVLNTATKKGEIEALLKSSGVPFYSKKGATPATRDCTVPIKQDQYYTTETRELALA